jgi:ABC-type glycerol-3-phosphate transport system substrate-binding protein
MKSPISRRSFLRVSAGVAGMAALAACMPPAPASPAAAGEEAAETGAVELEIWTGWTEDAATNIEKILSGYNESQDAIVAKHVVVPEAMTQKLLAAISAGSPPAGAIVFGANIAYQLAAQNAVLALDEIGNPEQVETLKGWMHPAIWDLGVYDGKFIYASMWNQCMGVFVNTTHAEAQGVDVTKPPATLEELDAIYDQLTTWDGDNIDVLGGDFTWTGMIMGRFLGQFVSEDGTTITANHENNVRALEWIANRWQTVGPQKLQDFYASLQGRGERSAGQDPFLSGLRATLVTGPWEYNTLRNFKPEGFEFTVWPFPGPAGQEEKGMYTYGDGWIVPSGTPDPSAIWEIISTMTGATGNRDVYTSLFTTWLCVNGPVSEQMTEWPMFQTEVMAQCPGYEEVFLPDLFASDYYLFPPKIPTSDSYSTMMDAEWEKVRLGQKGAQEALDFVQEEAQKELDTWLAQSGS